MHDAFEVSSQVHVAQWCQEMPRYHVQWTSWFVLYIWGYSHTDVASLLTTICGGVWSMAVNWSSVHGPSCALSEGGAISGSSVWAFDRTLFSRLLFRRAYRRREFNYSVRRLIQGTCEAAGSGPRREVGSIWQLRLVYTIHHSDLWKRMGNKDSCFFFLHLSTPQFAAKII